MPSYVGFGDRAEKRAAQSDVRAAVAAVETYYSDDESEGGGGGSYLDMTRAKLQAIDTAVTLSEEPSNLGPSTYCIQSTVGNFTAWKIDPSGPVTVGDKDEAAPAPC